MALDRRVVLAAVMVAALALTAYFAYIHSVPGGEGIVYPEELPPDATVVRVVEGEQAVEASRSIHWNPEGTGISEAVIVEYSDGTRLWVSRTVGDADQYLSAMIRKIQEYEGNLPFKVMHKISVKGTEVWVVMDKKVPGKIHLVWSKSGLVVWAEVPPGKSDFQHYMEVLVTGVDYR